MKKTLLGLTALALLSSPALAQGITFIDIDADASGDLSLGELQAVWPDFTAEAMAAADLDMSGGISQDEFNGLQASTMPAPVLEPTPLDAMSTPVDDGATDAPASLAEDSD